MRVMVTGADGQLGYDIVRRLDQKGVQCRGVDKADFDITDKKAVLEFFKGYKPDVIVHCAAYTAVDKAESERETAYQVNVKGTANLAEQAKALDAKFIYFSTDYVFDGTGDQPFPETQACNPLNYYGKTKYEGECAVTSLLNKFFIFRISWVFGAHGNNFVKTMLNLSNTRREITVVSDQIGSPTYTYDLAKLVYSMLESEAYGIYHATNTGYCSWYEFACAIFEKAGRDVIVCKIPASEYKTAAKRPMNSRLLQYKLLENGFEPLPPWQDALDRYLKEIL